MHRRGWFRLLLFVALVASARGVRPAPMIEEVPGFLLAPGEAFFGAFVRPVPSVSDGWRTQAREGWAAYLEEVRVGAPQRGPGMASLLVPVTGAGEEGQLYFRASAGSVAKGALLTHRGIYVGRVESVGEEEATARLFGFESHPPIGGQWQAASSSFPVRFVATGMGGRVSYDLPSRTVPPVDGQLAKTWDESLLGVARSDGEMPGGLLLGRFSVRQGDGLGGGSPEGEASMDLQPLFDVRSMPVVAVEVSEGVVLHSHQVAGHLLATTASKDKARVDVGSWDGVKNGDWVVQEGLFVGRIKTVGLTTSVLETACPEGLVLVLGTDPFVTPITKDRETWPKDWAPQKDALVIAGTLATGGCVVGTLDQWTEGNLTVTRPSPDPSTPVLVVRP